MLERSTRVSPAGQEGSFPSGMNGRACVCMQLSGRNFKSSTLATRLTLSNLNVALRYRLGLRAFEVLERPDSVKEAAWRSKSSQSPDSTFQYWSSRTQGRHLLGENVQQTAEEVYSTEAKVSSAEGETNRHVSGVFLTLFVNRARLFLSAVGIEPSVARRGDFFFYPSTRSLSDC